MYTCLLVFILYEAQINLTQNCQVGTKGNLSPLFKCIMRVDACYNIFWKRFPEIQQALYKDKVSMRALVVFSVSRRFSVTADTFIIHVCSWQSHVRSYWNQDTGEQQLKRSVMAKH